jgi:serine/threonine protein kinase
VMRPQLSNDPRFVERFKREAGAAGRIGHKNIVDITDFGRTADGRFYYVMEFLDGRTLASILGDEGAQPMPRVLHLALQMVQALGAAHRLGITHRDLKPENVMVLQRDNQADLVKIVDFGVAKETNGPRGAGHTAIGTLLGTPQYMAPEQAAGLEVDARSDIYSLGLIFYELITGRAAFQGETPSILRALQMTAPPPPMIEGRATPLPPVLEDLVHRMLAKKPSERPQNTDEVLDALELMRRRRRARMMRRQRR